MAGGAAVQGGPDVFEIGKCNMIALEKILRANNVMINGHDVGGTVSRTVTLSVGTGEVKVRTDGAETTL